MICGRSVLNGITHGRWIPLLISGALGWSLGGMQRGWWNGNSLW